MNPEILPKEIRARASRLWEGPVYWAPVRHHSPACAFALRRLMETVRPKTVLIEGPWDCNPLVDQLQSPDTRPPVALLSQKGDEEELYSAFFPLCDYSPEWVAIRTARSLKIPARFIDLPYGLRPASKIDEKAQSLMTERYLAHSRFLQAIAARMGCRDHFESWDRLFEQRPLSELDDWEGFFTDVYAYCELARRDYEPEVIAAEGDLDRERFMAARVREAIEESGGPLVAVVGGFHAPALATAVGRKQKIPEPKPTASDGDRNWLIRFSFDQLDSLNGYAAGMPAPAYYQAVWERMDGNAADYLSLSAADLLIRVAHDNRKQKLSRVVSSAEVQSALFQAEQLARLRGCSGPGRGEVLDAVQSCYAKDALPLSLSLVADARRVLSGDRLGDIPADTRQPPLVREAWRRGLDLKLDFESTQAKDLELDVYRKPRHLRISRYLHLMRWIDAGLAEWQSGPDFVNGHCLGLMREHWRYAWTPQVEARLLARIVDGTTLEQAATAKLRAVEKDLQAQGRGGRAGVGVALLIRACVMGLHRKAQTLANSIGASIDGDDRLSSVVDCARGLLALQKGRAVLESDRLDVDLPSLLRQCRRNALFLLPRLAGIKADDAAGTIPTMLALNVLRPEMGEDAETYDRILRRLLDDTNCPAVIRGGCLGLLFKNGELAGEDLDGCLAVFLKAQQPAEDAVGCLQGLIRVAREILWRIPEVLERLNRLVEKWPEERFLSLLPALRLLFTDLSPKEIDAVARQAAVLNGLTGECRLGEQAAFSPAELALGPALDEAVKRRIEEEHLTEWYFHEND